MYYIVETQKSFHQASEDLASAVMRNGFGVLQIHDLGATLRNKGIAFEEECKVFEVCNPAQAAKVLSADMHLIKLPKRLRKKPSQWLTRRGRHPAAPKTPCPYLRSLWNSLHGRALLALCSVT